MQNEILIVGLGWVGQANAIAFLSTGWKVYAKDIKEIKNIYSDPGLERLIWLKDGDETLSCDIMVCVNVPNDDYWDQSDAIYKLQEELQKIRKLSTGNLILRSTILPCYLKDLDFDFYVPEFLHERKGIQEAAFPEMLVIGQRRMKSSVVLDETHSWLADKSRFFIGTPEEAASIKYLSNCWNSLCIAFVNEFGDKINEEVSDPNRVIDFLFQRKPYLRYGRSFAGDCLVKDSQAFVYYYNSKIMKATLKANTKHSYKDNLEELHYGDCK